MTDPQQVSTRKRNPSGVVVLIIGALLVIGGVVEGLVAKASADRAAHATGARSLSVGSYGGFNFRFTHTAHLDYTGLWIGVVVAAIGVVVLVIGIILVARKRRVA